MYSINSTKIDLLLSYCNFFKVKQWGQQEIVSGSEEMEQRNEFDAFNDHITLFFQYVEQLMFTLYDDIEKNKL